MTKTKEGHIKDCINCHTDKKVKAEDKVESRSFNGWNRKEKRMLKLHKDNFDAWLSGRIRNAARGQILDLEQGIYVDVATARSHVFLEHARRRGEYNKKEQTDAVRQVSLDQAKADPNDPWAFSRTKTHLENGLCDLDDYHVEFARITVDMLDLLTGEVIGRKMADVPMRVRRA